LFELFSGALGLTCLEVAQGEIDPGGNFLGKGGSEALVDGDGSGVKAQAEVDLGEQVLPLGLARLHSQSVFDLALGFVDLVLLEQLGATIEVEKKVRTRQVVGW
jgi:hypothetical protein